MSSGDTMRTVHSNAFANNRSSDTILLSEMGRTLRSAYSEVLKEPMPERINRLLQRLESSDSRSTNDESR